MSKSITASSSRTWGREDYKEDDELSRLYAEFLNKLELPKDWKCIGDVNVISDTMVFKNGIQIEQKNVCFTAGKLYRDMRTQGINLREYRVFWNSFSGKCGIVERQRPDFGQDWHKTCLISNKTIEQINQYIHERFDDLSENKIIETSEETKEEIERLRTLINNL